MGGLCGYVGVVSVKGILIARMVHRNLRFGNLLVESFYRLFIASGTIVMSLSSTSRIL